MNFFLQISIKVKQVMKMSFFLIVDFTPKTGKWVLFRKRRNFQIQDTFEDGKPIVLKTVKGYVLRWKT